VINKIINFIFGVPVVIQELFFYKFIRMTTINAVREKLTVKINQIERVDLLEYLL